MLSRQSTAQRLNATLPVRAMLAADRTQRAGSGSDACDHWLSKHIGGLFCDLEVKYLGATCFFLSFYLKKVPTNDVNTRYIYKIKLDLKLIK